MNVYLSRHARKDPDEYVPEPLTWGEIGFLVLSFLIVLAFVLGVLSLA